ncbi:F-box/LRR-repeat protein 14 [Frankliniella fusca]|uniref:F-box/LRR-repeat protein 14 n=1 Tax=Frankliniella fusca TaxID=407009 RepID=A0AAE1HXJ0_9NEOP|nr:F-box/LRR-repeat protein 14 [Frankliniella fusca]
MASNGCVECGTTILDLPEEVSILIFSFLSASELGDSISKVCTLWRDYSKAFQLWKRLDYTVDGVLSKREQISVFQTASAFRRLTLKDGTSLGCLLPLLFCNCSNIQELVICGEDMDPGVLRRLAQHYKGSIFSLTLEGMELNNSWYSAISDLAKGLNSLTLRADCCVWAMGLLSVECTALTSLRLTSCRQTVDQSRQMQGVKRMLRLLPDGLQTLQLGAHISPNADIVLAIGEKRRIENLILEDCCEVLDKDLLNLLSLGQLQNLQLWRAHRVSSEGLFNFINYSRFPCLLHLDLFDCPNLNDDVLQEISIKCRNLKTLDISSCHLLTDYGIASVFQFCSELQTLRMSHLPQPTGHGYLDQLPQLLPKLIYLDAYNCCNIPSDLLEGLENNKLIVMSGRRGRRR